MMLNDVCTLKRDKKSAKTMVLLKEVVENVETSQKSQLFKKKKK